MGKPCSEETRSKISAALRGRKSPKIAEALRRRWAEGKMRGHTFTEEQRRRISENQPPKPPGFGAKVSAGMRASDRWQATAAENGRKAGIKLRGRPKTHPLLAKGEGHWKSKRWAIRSPRGAVYVFKNLNEFVRTHTELFDPLDVVWRGSRCRASSGISNMFYPSGPGSKRIQPGQWKGWTIYSIPERRWNDGDDLIERSDFTIDTSTRTDG